MIWKSKFAGGHYSKKKFTSNLFTTTPSPWISLELEGLLPKEWIESSVDDTFKKKVWLGNPVRMIHTNYQYLRRILESIKESNDAKEESK